MTSKDYQTRRLIGRSAFVTGGLNGIGRACVERFIAEGALVTLCDLAPEGSDTVATALEELGAQAAYIQADVTSEADWQRACDVLQKRDGKLHILVNNAGVHQTGALSELTSETWHRVMNVNTTSAFYGAKALQPLLALGGEAVHGGASIINISSIAGLVGYEESAAYCASKGAVRLLTKSIALEFALKRIPIRANSVHPGCVMTPLLEAGFQNWVDSDFAASVDQLVQLVADKTPMGRLGEPAEIAAGVAFLASGDSAYMTGSELVMDGGWTAQ
jgi:NAD(P)-dependent dehydrogenase (short-subunit alcohol dehydrogenase family)